MATLCRLCLQYSATTGVPSIRDKDLKDKLDRVFRFSIADDENFPDTVCRDCFEKVTDYDAYCVLVQTNQDKLWAQKTEAKPDHIEELPKIEPLSDDDEFEEWHDGEVDEPDVKVEIKAESLPLLEDGKDDRKPLEEEGETKQDDDDKTLLEFFQIVCEICTNKFQSFAGLKLHFRKVHNTRGYLKCCDKTFFQRYKLMEHISIHTGASSVRCEICKKTFSSKSYLQMHMNKLHGKEEDRPYKCTQCKQSFAMECLLRAHRVHHVPVKCTVCEKMLSSSLSLRVHMVNIHGNRENHVCDICGKEFRSRPPFDRHMKIHQGIAVEEPVQCTVCSKWLHSKRALWTHVKIVHKEAGQVFRCDICQHESPNSRALGVHKERVHSGERFECEVCGKRFKRKIYLTEHLASHTGKMLYSCDFCESRFNSKANLYAHRKKTHPAEWEAKKLQRQAETARGQLML